MAGERGMGGRSGGPGGQYLTEEEKRSQPKITKALLARVFSYFSPYKGKLALVVLCIIASSVLSLAPTILTGRIIDDGLIGRNMQVLAILVSASLAVTVLSNLIGVGQAYLNSWISQHIAFDMRNSMYKHLQTMSQRFFTTNSQGDIITRMTSDISGVDQVISSSFTSVISNVITLIVAMVAMFTTNWIMALLGLLIVPFFILPTRAAGKKRWELTSKAQECNDEINGILNETLSVSGQTLVKLFCKEDFEYNRYVDANSRMIDLNIKESMAGRWFFAALSALSSVGPMLLYLGGGILIMQYDSSLTVGGITVLVTLLGRLYGPINSLLNLQVTWVRSMAMFTRIFEYFDMKPEIENSPEAITPCNEDGEPCKASGTVEFANVNFSYEKGHEVLHDVNFKLEKGKSIALVGPSGSGKSSIVNLIPRLYDVDAGTVKFDDIDVRDLDLAFLRQNIGIVTQETYLFNGTIRDNLLYVKPSATEEELRDACEKANILEFIDKQEEGFDTRVGNRGLKLSGGEKQRISIARILLKDPALLIFDEATSALDSVSEAKIQQAVNDLVKTHTSILIAHRLSTVLSADEILVVKDGRIVESGQHADLVNAGGVYAELYETQFQSAMQAEQAAGRWANVKTTDAGTQAILERTQEAEENDQLAQRVQESEMQLRALEDLMFGADPYGERALYVAPDWANRRMPRIRTRKIA